jgi:hypothetical protein
MAPTSSSVFARRACWRANSASASRAARVDCRLATSARCDAESISNSGVPGVTRSPDLTRIDVRKPSACGWIVVDLRDRIRLLRERQDFDGQALRGAARGSRVGRCRRRSAAGRRHREGGRSQRRQDGSSVPGKRPARLTS